MSELTTRNTLHKRLTNFVEWIKPDPDKNDDVKKRRDAIRKNITNKANEDKIIVVSTPNAGSHETKTGLRRHYKGSAEVEGQDVDLPFIVDPKSFDDNWFNSLLGKFKGYAEKSYPDTEIELTKSSIKLKFADKVNFDIVPMLGTKKHDEQKIHRSNGEIVTTSVQKHVQFIKSRNQKSNEQKGRVKFNECVRLLKWWRDFQGNDSYYLGGNKVPSSFLINLLAAKAFDTLSVETTYAETLWKWSGYLGNQIRSKNTICFNDFNSGSIEESGVWSVIDPVTGDNNVTKNWTSIEVDELADWFDNSADNWNRVIRHHADNDDVKSLQYLVELFGNPFKNHCDN